MVAATTMLAFAFILVAQAAASTALRAADRYFRKLQAERYEQLVVLPLIGAIVGGLIATAIPIIISHPPWKHDSMTNVAYILFTTALIVGVAGPLVMHTLYENPQNLLIGERIDRLKNGDLTGDTKAIVIDTIDECRFAITKQKNSKGIWFLVLLVLVAASGVCWSVLFFVKDEVLSGVIVMVVTAAAILCGFGARYRLWRKSLRSTLTYLDDLKAEADQLSPPASTAPPSRESTVNHHRDLWVGVGGLLVGAILARLGSVRSRGEQQD